MQLTIDLNDDASEAYGDLLDALGDQADMEIDAETHAEAVLRNYIAAEYSELPPSDQTVPLAAIVDDDGEQQ